MALMVAASKGLRPVARSPIDLKVFVYESGEALLADMERSGAQLTAAGAGNKHLISSLKNGESHPWRRWLQDLRTRCRENGAPKGGEQ